MAIHSRSSDSCVQRHLSSLREAQIAAVVTNLQKPSDTRASCGDVQVEALQELSRLMQLPGSREGQADKLRLSSIQVCIWQGFNQYWLCRFEGHTQVWLDCIGHTDQHSVQCVLKAMPARELLLSIADRAMYC